MNPLAWFAGAWQGYVAAGVLSAVLAASAAYYVTSLPYKSTIANMKAVQAQQQADSYRAALDQFTADAGRIHDAAGQYGAITADFHQRLTDITKEFAHAVQDHPLPPDCLPGPERMRKLAAAIAATNRAAVGAKPGPAVPATP